VPILYLYQCDNTCFTVLVLLADFFPKLLWFKLAAGNEDPTAAGSPLPFPPSQMGRRKRQKVKLMG